MANGYIIFFGLITVYMAAIIFLKRTGYFDKLNMSLLGPILMIRTQRGKKAIAKIAKLKRFWKWFANIGLGITYLSMFMMFGVLILSTIGSTMKEIEPVPASDILVIPGVNNLIPLSYGIIALIIGIVVHEFSHGIMALVAKLKVKSMGVLMLVVPIGAFVEPDDKELKGTTRIKRMRLYASGPTMNIVVGLICACIFSWGMMGSLTVVEEGVMVYSLTVDYPAEEGGLEVGMLITELTVYRNVTENNTSVDTYRTLNESGELFNGFSQYDKLDIELKKIKKISNDTFTWLVNQLAGSNSSFTITHIAVTDHPSFSDGLSVLSDQDKIDIGVYYKGDGKTFSNITLTEKYRHTNEERDRGKGFLGVGVQDPQKIIETLHRPIASADSPGEVGLNLVTYSIMLPMNTKMMPFHSPLTDVYEVGGFWSLIGENGFWFLANTFYYLFWLNILIGTFNTLPCIPVDGGFIFRDTFAAILEKMGKKISKKKRDRITSIVSITTALSIGFMILFIIFFPRLR
ncbi:MAG: site-2 protease family protein [Candidatus Thermoplasmatota archaeon]|jgi:membrane-associated protease RseP (regulator of RpoE activity)|nr:site-2 protease family protein [Candidatus Thermoplasmatota archaeon]